MKFLFDNNLSPHLARGVAALTSKAAYRVPYKRQGQRTLEQIRA